MSTATARLRLEKQDTGSNNNSWGVILNTNGLDLIDAAIAGMASYTLSGSKTLTSNNYAADEARMPFQNITGGTGGTVTVPAAEGKWFFYNQSSGSVIVTTGSGDTATLVSGEAVWVFTDGTDCYTGLTKSYVDAAIAAAVLGGITTLPADQGGTGQTSYTIGDLLQASASGTLSKLASVATGNVLISGGVGAVSIWGKVGLTTHVSGTLPVANGGTGVTSSTGSGANVQAVSPALTTPTITGGTQSSPTITTPAITTPTLTGTPIEDVYTITDGAAFEVDPANGSIQLVTLGANRTPKGTNFTNGQSITLGVDDGTARTLTWTDATWGGSGVKWLGGTAPTLATSGLTWITLWKVGGQVYGSSPGASS